MSPNCRQGMVLMCVFGRFEPVPALPTNKDREPASREVPGGPEPPVSRGLHRAWREAEEAAGLCAREGPGGVPIRSFLGPPARLLCVRAFPADLSADPRAHGGRRVPAAHGGGR